jgi:hypothetical protein
MILKFHNKYGLYDERNHKWIIQPKYDSISNCFSNRTKPEIVEFKKEFYYHNDNEFLYTNNKTIKSFNKLKIIFKFNFNFYLCVDRTDLFNIKYEYYKENGELMFIDYDKSVSLNYNIFIEYGKKIYCNKLKIDKIDKILK